MDLTELREVAQKEKDRQRPTRLHCCTSTGCRAASAAEVYDNLKASVKQHECGDRLEIVSVGCMGFCGQGPLVQVDPENQLYAQVKPEEADGIVAATLGEGTAAAEQLDPQHPFFAYQTPIVRKNSGKVNPESIEEYIAVGGYESLYKVLYEMDAGSRGDGSFHQRSAGPGRGRLSHRIEMGHRSQDARRPEVHHLQRRRRRPWRVYGSQCAGE
jgi:bidirectional [NiFe] hydrogenase diaphorase subunit